jgi:hypothetical protein
MVVVFEYLPVLFKKILQFFLCADEVQAHVSRMAWSDERFFEPSFDDATIFDWHPPVGFSLEIATCDAIIFFFLLLFS